VIAVMEAVAHARAVKTASAGIAKEHSSVSSQVIASRAAVDKSATEGSAAERGTYVSAAGCRTYVSASKSAATATSGGKRVGRHHCTDCDGGEENHRIARHKLLLDILNECMGVCL
jgi:hypothetical protein